MGVGVEVVEIPEYLSVRDCSNIVKIVDYESGRIHVSWETANQKIIAFEYIPDNRPEGALIVFRDAREYLQEVAPFVKESARDELVSYARLLGIPNEEIEELLQSR